MVFVTGDCHGNFARFEQKHFPEQANMTKDDTVIITGDFGGVWFGDSRSFFAPAADLPTDLAVQFHLRKLRRHKRVQRGKQGAVICGLADIHSFSFPARCA